MSINSTLYQRFAQSVAWIALLSSAVGIWIGVGAVLTNGRQDAQRATEAKIRDEEQATLLGCFDRFATALAGSLPPVREASAYRDNATAVRDTAMQQVARELGKVIRAAVEGTLDDPADDLKALSRALDRLTVAGERLDTAQAALEEARAENPYPAPPSSFCTLND